MCVGVGVWGWVYGVVCSLPVPDRRVMDRGGGVCVCVHVLCLLPSSNAVFGDKGTADVGNDENNLFVSPQAKVVQRLQVLEITVDTGVQSYRVLMYINQC